MILFKPILINHLYLIIYPSRDKLTSAHLHKKRGMTNDDSQPLCLLFCNPVTYRMDLAMAFASGILLWRFATRFLSLG